MRWLAFWVAAAVWAGPVEISPAVVSQGQTVRVTAPASAAGARMNGRTIRLFPWEGGTFGLMPVPVKEAPGTYQIEVLDGSNAVIGPAAIAVRNAHYPSQNIVISRTLSELQPSQAETETMTAFRTTVSAVRFWKDPLTAPVPGCATSPFGVKRLHNGRPTGEYHGGVDLRARAGDPVRATAAGTVIVARQFALRGGTVGIDHGQGLESLYMHLAKVAVAEGAKVEQGGVIGYAGSTGRSTAPHLHWAIYVNGVNVSPLQWVRIGSCGQPARPRRARRQQAS